MTALPHSIVAALRGGGDDRTLHTLRSVTDLFMSQADAMGEEGIALFDQVLNLLADRIEAAARAELSERLAGHGKAPPALIRRLAHDEIVVAAPVIERSPVLSDGDLVAIALAHGSAHMLAIAMRAELSPVVTDVLVERGDHEVLQRTVDNEGARFSERGFSTAVTRAQDSERLQLSLGRRGDLPLDRLGELVAIATERARARLLPLVTGRRAAELGGALDRAGAGLLASGLATLESDAVAVEEVTARHRREPLTEADVRGFAIAGDRARAFAALALMARLPDGVAHRLLTDPDDELLLVVGRALALSWETIDALQSFKLRPANRPYEPERVRDSYERLAPGTAQRVLGFLTMKRTGKADRASVAGGAGVAGRAQ
jgi:uncharacterized protein (DUF2336 family)